MDFHILPQTLVPFLINKFIFIFWLFLFLFIYLQNFTNSTYLFQLVRKDVRPKRCAIVYHCLLCMWPWTPLQNQ